MPVGVVTIELEIPASSSLKDKRRIVKSVSVRLRQRYNLAVAEVGELEDWHRATLALATVANDAAHVHRQLQKAVDALASWRLDCIVGLYDIEIW